MIQIKALFLFQGNSQNNYQILTLKIVLHYRDNNFYALVTPGERDQRQRKQIIKKETDTTAIMLYSIKKETGRER